MADAIEEEPTHVRWWLPIVLAAMAGGMGWGIRGQYGHETGAMVPGLLVSLTLAFLLCRGAGTLSIARAVAWGTVAIGIGGSMTYGQTVGLTHDAPLIGNWDALRWGMLGLAIKGGIWIGFGGLFLGMGMGGTRYRAVEILCLLVAVLAAAYLGIRVLNSPFDPEGRTLPLIYFSDDWHWEPEGDLEPRPEVWGGLLFALAFAVAYAGWVRRDRLARNLALWGILGGALGFPGGQSIQAFHAWNRELFDDGFLKLITTGMNPWNVMETTFGATMGAALGLGAWLNREKIAPREDDEPGRLPPGLEWVLLAIHMTLLVAVDFGAYPMVDLVYDFGLGLTLIPLVAITQGRWWPFLQIYVVTLVPIAGKTLRELAYRSDTIGRAAGWTVYVIVPLVVAAALAVWAARRARRGDDGRAFARRTLLFGTWLYFGLNHAFFRFPWPWREWTGRSHNGLIFTVSAVGLTLGALLARREPRLPS